MTNISQMKKIVPLILCEIPFSQHVYGFEFLESNKSCPTFNPEQLFGSVKHVSLWDFMFVGLTLVCLIGIGLCVLGLTIADGFLRISLVSFCFVRYEKKTSISKCRNDLMVRVSFLEP